MRLSIPISVLGLTLAVSIMAQEKPVPGQRAAGITPPDSIVRTVPQENATKSTQGLPKFDIPEYVITGAVSFDLPDVSKQEAAEPAHILELADPTASTRDRSTFNFVTEQKSSLTSNPTRIGYGRLQGSSGTYLTSHLGLRIGAFGPTSFFGADADYRSAKAYVPFTNRSGGDVRFRGELALTSPGNWFDRGTLGGEIGYGSETYRFYGYRNPALTRAITRFALSAHYGSPRELLFSHEANIGLALKTIKDSSSSVTETRFGLGAAVNLPVGTFPLNARIDFGLASITGASSKTLPFVDAQFFSEKVWYGDFSVQGALHGYLAQGMLSQKFARLYPHVSLGYRFVQNTVLALSYAGRVHQNTLSALTAAHPYVSANATVRQSDVPIDVMASFETDWTPVWRTRLSARLQSVRDFPLLTEGGLKGIWATDYQGTTRIGTYQADLFAKFDANSYFTLSLEINDSKNTSTQRKVPYLPEARLSGSAWFEVARGLSICPSLSYVGNRVPDLLVADKLGGYVCANLRAEYIVLEFLEVGVDFRNFTNTRYEEWSGYQAVPATITAGLTCRW